MQNTTSFSKYVICYFVDMDTFPDDWQSFLEQKYECSIVWQSLLNTVMYVGQAHH